MISNHVTGGGLKQWWASCKILDQCINHNKTGPTRWINLLVVSWPSGLLVGSFTTLLPWVQIPPVLWFVFNRIIKISSIIISVLIASFFLTLCTKICNNWPVNINVRVDGTHLWSLVLAFLFSLQVVSGTFQVHSKLLILLFFLGCMYSQHILGPELYWYPFNTRHCQRFYY